jgi:hypothetical protein
MAATGNRANHGTSRGSITASRRSSITLVATALERPNEGDEAEWVFVDDEDSHLAL